MGCSVAMIFSAFGAAYGIAKSGTGISAVSVLRPDLMVRSKLSHLTTRIHLLLSLSGNDN
jgi:V-type H+-transporting ATPase proteolipid subunit